VGTVGMGGLETDLYEIRMAASYLRQAMVGPATFSLFVRDLPAERGFLVAAGLADCLAFLQDFRFSADELGYLAEVGVSARDRAARRRCGSPARRGRCRRVGWSSPASRC
jgi:nicotinate phosphoribosyltransferase